MRIAYPKHLILLTTMFLLCPQVFADQITLKNGDRLTGTIVKSDAKTLVIKTEAAGDVTSSGLQSTPLPPHSPFTSASRAGKRSSGR